MKLKKTKSKNSDVPAKFEDGARALLTATIRDPDTKCADKLSEEDITNTLVYKTV